MNLNIQCYCIWHVRSLYNVAQLAFCSWFILSEPKLHFKTLGLAMEYSNFIYRVVSHIWNFIFNRNIVMHSSSTIFYKVGMVIDAGWHFQKKSFCINANKEGSGSLFLLTQDCGGDLAVHFSVHRSIWSSVMFWLKFFNMALWVRTRRSQAYRKRS